MSAIGNEPTRRRNKGSGTLRRLLIKVTVVGSAIGVAIALAEVASRMLHDVTLPRFTADTGEPEAMFRSDPMLGGRTVANLHGWFSAAEYRTRVDTNADGFRMPGDLAPAKRGVLRVLVLGDSFTFGMGVEERETYAAVLQRLLNAHGGTAAEVLNLGVIGYGTLQEIELLHQYAFLEPDIVIIGFFARDSFLAASANDLEDNYYFAKGLHAAPGDGRSDPRATDLPLSRKVRLRLLWHSNLYRLTELALGGYLRRRYAPSDDPALREQAWRITGDALTALDREFESEGVRGVLLWIPDPATVARQNHSVAVRLDGLGLKHIEVVDMLGVLQGGGAPAYFNLDSHLNANGHALAASALLLPVTRAARARGE